MTLAVGPDRRHPHRELIDLERNDTVTLTEETTRTLDVPGDLDLRRPPRRLGGRDSLFLTASPMAAAGFGTLAGHFTDRTVITYDPRGSDAAS